MHLQLDGFTTIKTPCPFVMFHLLFHHSHLFHVVAFVHPKICESCHFLGSSLILAFSGWHQDILKCQRPFARGAITLHGQLGANLEFDDNYKNEPWVLCYLTNDATLGDDDPAKSEKTP